MRIQVWQTKARTALPPACCPECGFDLEVRTTETVLFTIAGADRTFATLLRDSTVGVSGERHPPGPDGWSQIEHVVHVADAMTAARRRILRIAVGDCRAHLPHIEVPQDISQNADLGAALSQLDAAARSLILVADALPASARSRADIHRTLTRAAHEVIHHSQLVGAATEGIQPWVLGA